jgi:hypothetical protein
MAQSALKTNQDYFEQLFRGLKNPELYSAKGVYFSNSEYANKLGFSKNVAKYKVLWSYITLGIRYEKFDNS